MKFTKKQFEETYVPGEMDELYDPNSGEIGGDKPELEVVSQITTDTPKAFDDKSDYKQDIPLDGDKFAANTKNKSNTDLRFNQGSPYGRSGSARIGESETRKMVEKFLHQRNSNNDFVDRSQDNEIGDEPQIDNIRVVTKTKEFLSAITSLSDEDKKVVMDFIANKINL